MALYNLLPPSAFERIAEAFALGPVLDVKGIPQGSINTNYRLVTAKGSFFVRYATHRSEADLRFEAKLLQLLALAAFPGPVLQTTSTQAAWLPWDAGFVSVFHWLVGEELGRAQLTPTHLERLGAELAKLHRLGQGLLGERENPYGLPCVLTWLEGLARHEDEAIRALAEALTETLLHAESARQGLEPLGVIHADLFLDNVKWLDGRVSAFFDFEMACRAPLGLDLAITLNAWCFEAGRYEIENARALIRGYQQEQPLSEVQRANLFGHALFGAVRYTASRIRDFHLSPLPPDRLARKDFRTYLARTQALSEMGPHAFRTMLGL